MVRKVSNKQLYTIVIMFITILLGGIGLIFKLSLSGIIYPCIFGTILYVISRYMLKEEQAQYSICSTLYFAIFIVIAALSFYTKSSASYYELAPIFSVDTNNSWHQDTAFNLSLIQSILNWGYPSVALDGHPFTAYHTISHYVDALLYQLSGLPVYDSYGFTGLVKATFFVSAIFLVLLSLQPYRALFVSLCIVSAIVVASWHAMLSHAMWFPSFVLVLSTPFFAKVAFSEQAGKAQDYVGVFCLFIVLCLGKVSSGLAFALLFFSIRFLIDYKNIRLYVTAVAAMVFLLFYQKFINYSYGANTSFQWSLDFSLLKDMRYATVFFALCGALLVLRAVTINVYKNTRFLFALTGSYGCLLFLTMMVAGLSWSDRHYFYLGAYSVVVLLLIYYVFSELPNSKEVQMVSLLLFVIIGFFVYQPVFSVSNLSLATLQSHYKYLMTQQKRIGMIKEDGSAYKLKEFVDSLIREDGYSRGHLAMFIPKTILEKQVVRESRRNFYTMNLYAITGVQILKGVLGTQRAYGFANYGQDSFVVDKLEYQEQCRKLKLEAIIKIEDYHNSSYQLIKCDGS